MGVQSQEEILQDEIHALKKEVRALKDSARGAELALTALGENFHELKQQFEALSRACAKAGRAAQGFTKF